MSVVYIVLMVFAQSLMLAHLEHKHTTAINYVFVHSGVVILPIARICGLIYQNYNDAVCIIDPLLAISYHIMKRNIEPFIFYIH